MIRVNCQEREPDGKYAKLWQIEPRLLIYRYVEDSIFVRKGDAGRVRPYPGKRIKNFADILKENEGFNTTRISLSSSWWNSLQAYPDDTGLPDVVRNTEELTPDGLRMYRVMQEAQKRRVCSTSCCRIES